MDKQVVISTKTIITTLLLILGGYVVYRLGAVIGILLLATLLVISMEHSVKYFMKLIVLNRKIPRSVAVLISYLIFVLILIVVVVFVLPPVVTEIQKIVVSLSSSIGQIETPKGWQISFANVIPNVSEISGKVLSATFSVFSNVATFISLLVISIYMSLDWINIKKSFISLFPEKMESDVEDTINEIEDNIGHWIKGQLTLMLIIGLASFVGLSILGVRYALALSLLAGVFEAVPTIGPILSAILAGAVGFSDSPVKGMGVIALFIVIQQLENNILVPKIMEKASGFRPLAILLAILVGGSFFGVIGVICAVPLMMILSIILKRFLRSNN